MSTAKRVRFDVAEDSDEEDATASKRGRTVLPAPKEPKAVSIARRLGAGEASTPADEGDATTTQLLCDAEAMDPTEAAAQRASRRQSRVEAVILDDMDIAEEDEPEELFNDSGIPFEPFNLRREQEEGYFDTDGNYIEFRAERSDPWLATVEDTLTSLAEGMDPSEIVAGAAPPAIGQEATWSQEDVRQHKEAIIMLLAPGETVLDALRRLRSASGTQPGRRTARTVLPENRDAFDRLTDSAQVLLDHGDTNSYSDTREEFRADLRIASVETSLGDALLHNAAREGPEQEGMVSNAAHTEQAAPADAEVDIFGEGSAGDDAMKVDEQNGLSRTRQENVSVSVH